MLLVKTKILQSKLHGLGLFADQFIPKGTEVCRFTPGFDQKFTAEQILAFPKLLQIYFYHSSWLSSKSHLYILPSDGCRFTNHSNDPNTLSEYSETEEEAVSKAIRDINPGEEIIEDYASFEDFTTNNLYHLIDEKYHLTEDELDPRAKQ